MLPRPGKYTAYVGEKSLYPAQSGALMWCINCIIDENTSIKAYQALGCKDGSLNERTIENVKKVFGWDGQDLDWLVNHDFGNREISITVEEEVYEGKPRSYVKWINLPGEGGGEMTQGDMNQIKSQWGAKFRAISGGNSFAPNQNPAPSAPPANTGKKEVYVPDGAKGVTMEEAWKKVCQGAPAGTSRDALTEVWMEAKKKIGRSEDTFRPEDWGRIQDGCLKYFQELI